MTIQWLSSKRVEGDDGEQDTILNPNTLEIGYSFTAVDTPQEYIWNGVDTWTAIGGGAPVGGIVATGGTRTQVGDFKVHTFNGDGNFDVTEIGTGASGTQIEYLVVAGGGAGGFNVGGAGGGGAYRTADDFIVSVQNYPITVGDGGLVVSNNTGANGGDSVFDTITSNGGGGGGTANANGNNSNNGSGGSGSIVGTGGSGGAFGNDGGDGFGGSGGSGGGGGSSTVGANGGASTSGNGGDGIQSAIDGILTNRGCGGGAGDRTTATPGGLGGSGHTTSDGGTGAVGGTALTNSGDGGGGGGNNGVSGFEGGAGGSGVVILRYFSPAVPFSPTDISQLRAWYDATDLTTITKDGSDRVSQWRIKAGVSVPLDQVTAGNQPLWVSDGRAGNPVIDFSTDRFLRGEYATPYNYPLTIIYICELADNTGAELIMINPFDTNASNFGLRKNAAANSFAMLSSGGSVTVVEAGNAGQWKYLTLVWDGASSDFRIDGVSKQTGTTGNGTSVPLSLGVLAASDSRFANNKVMHILAYEKVLSAQELSDIETWASEQIALEPTTTIYDFSTSQTQQEIRAGVAYRVGVAIGGGNVGIGKFIQEIMFPMKKAGTPPNTFRYEVYDTDGILKGQTETSVADSLTTSFVQTALSLPVPIQIEFDDRIVCTYNDGNISDKILIEGNNNATIPVNTQRAQYDGSWAFDVTQWVLGKFDNNPTA